MGESSQVAIAAINSHLYTRPYRGSEEDVVVDVDIGSGSPGCRMF